MVTENKMLKKLNKLINNFWFRIFLIIILPLILIKVVNPEWLMRFVLLIILFLIVLLVGIKELFRKDYSDVKVFKGKERKGLILFVKIFSVILIGLFLYASFTYIKDVDYLLKNKQPKVLSGEVVGTRTSAAFSGLGYFGQSLEIENKQGATDSFTKIFNRFIKKGENIKFYYLPNSKVILEILD